MSSTATIRELLSKRSGSKKKYLRLPREASETRSARKRRFDSVRKKLSKSLSSDVRKSLVKFFSPSRYDPPKTSANVQGSRESQKMTKDVVHGTTILHDTQSRQLSSPTLPPEPPRNKEELLLLEDRSLYPESPIMRSRMVSYRTFGGRYEVSEEPQMIKSRQLIPKGAQGRMPPNTLPNPCYPLDPNLREEQLWYGQNPSQYPLPPFESQMQSTVNPYRQSQPPGYDQFRGQYVPPERTPQTPCMIYPSVQGQPCGEIRYVQVTQESEVSSGQAALPHAHNSNRWPISNHRAPFSGRSSSNFPNPKIETVFFKPTSESGLTSFKKVSEVPRTRPLESKQTIGESRENMAGESKQINYDYRGNERVVHRPTKQYSYDKDSNRPIKVVNRHNNVIQDLTCAMDKPCHCVCPNCYNKIETNVHPVVKQNRKTQSPQRGKTTQKSHGFFVWHSPKSKVIVLDQNYNKQPKSFSFV